jgi:RNA polymerase sigma-70 factor (ECF subfamily)
MLETHETGKLMPGPAEVAVPLDELSEAELVALLRRGDARAFCMVMRRNNRRLYRAVRSVLRDDADAEDAVQDAYLRAFCALEQFKGESSLSTWLTRIAVNEALGRVRRRQPMIEDLSDGREDASARVIPFPLTRAGVEPDPERAVATAEIRRLLEGAIDELPTAFRVVFVLREIEQMSTAESAACLDLPLDTVKTRLHRAKRLLRNALKERLASTLTDTFPFEGQRCARMADRVLQRMGLAEPSSPR